MNEEYGLGVRRGGVSDYGDALRRGDGEYLFVAAGAYHEVADLARRLFDKGLIDQAVIAPSLFEGAVVEIKANARLILDALRGREQP